MRNLKRSPEVFVKKDPLGAYLATRALTSPWRLGGEAGDGFAGCVVIPALAESERLFATLASLAANPPELLAKFLVVVVVNHREDAAKPEKEDNTATLALLRSFRSPLRLAWVDAATEGLELPASTGGVGLARRIGMDLALPRLLPEGVLVCLDADTLVAPDYLPAIAAHFAQSRAGGAVIPFVHQRGSTASEERAITLYELYLRHYVLGLRRAGSPYAFHCVGSAMACTAAAYARMGGMNCRRAGEDFYFLQQLQRTAGMERVRGTTVHPSARSSHRVPFGTGKSISRLLAEGEDSQTFYRVDCFRILERWLSLVAEGGELTARELLTASAAIDPQLHAYLEQSRFEQVWERLKKNSGSADRLRDAFHGWFDALKTVRLVHHLSLAYPRCSAPEALPPLLEFCGLSPLQRQADADNPAEPLLELLRGVQNAAHSN